MLSKRDLHGVQELDDKEDQEDPVEERDRIRERTDPIELLDEARHSVDHKGDSGGGEKQPESDVDNIFDDAECAGDPLSGRDTGNVGWFCDEPL